MSSGPYREQAGVAPDPTALEQLLARVRVRKGVRPVRRTEASLPLYQRSVFRRHLVLIPIAVVVLGAAACWALAVLIGPSKPGSAEAFCGALPAGMPEGTALRGGQGRFGMDLCEVHVAGGVITSAKYLGY